MKAELEFRDNCAGMLILIPENKTEYFACETFIREYWGPALSRDGIVKNAIGIEVQETNHD